MPVDKTRRQAYTVGMRLRGLSIRQRGYCGHWSELDQLRNRVSELDDEVARLRQLTEPEELSAEPALTYDQAKSAALEMVRERGELSYSDLVFELGLTIEDAVHVFDDLEEEGQIREKPAASQD